MYIYIYIYMSKTIDYWIKIAVEKMKKFMIALLDQSLFDKENILNQLNLDAESLKILKGNLSDKKRAFVFENMKYLYDLAICQS